VLGFVGSITEVGLSTKKGVSMMNGFSCDVEGVYGRRWMKTVRRLRLWREMKMN